METGIISICTIFDFVNTMYFVLFLSIITNEYKDNIAWYNIA